MSCWRGWSLAGPPSVTTTGFLAALPCCFPKGGRSRGSPSGTPLAGSGQATKRWKGREVLVRMKTETGEGKASDYR
eukprot:gene16791-biopygen17284